MNRRYLILVAAFILALVSTACGADINLNFMEMETGPTKTIDIQVPLLEESSTSVELNLEFVTGELKLAPGWRKVK